MILVLATTITAKFNSSNDEGNLRLALYQAKEKDKGCNGKQVHNSQVF
jgi:hypothetical protein